MVYSVHFMGAFFLTNAEEVLQNIYYLEGKKISGKLRKILCYRECDLEKILRQSKDEEKKIDS